MYVLRLNDEITVILFVERNAITSSPRKQSRSPGITWEKELHSFRTDKSKNYSENSVWWKTAFRYLNWQNMRQLVIYLLYSKSLSLPGRRQDKQCFVTIC